MSSTNYQTVWQILESTALMGTDRASLDLPTAHTPLDQLLTALQNSQAEPTSVLLAAAGTLSLYESAGTVPIIIKDAPIPALEETWPVCSSQTRTHLAHILTERKLEPLFRQWLSLAFQTQVRIPYDHLATIVTSPNLMSIVIDYLPVIGQRGHWLAAQDPQWASTAGLMPTEVWDTGNAKARLAAFTALRRVDPTQARQLLMNSWPDESASQRAGFIHALSTNLSEADVPLLNKALQDKHKATRDEAKQLLYRLPASGIGEYIAKALLPCFRWSGKSLFKKRRLHVTLPATSEKIIIDEDTHIDNENAELILPNIISLVPPSLWEQAWQASPTEIIDALQSKYRQDIIVSWARVAGMFNDEAWQAALLTVAVENPKWDELHSELREWLKPPNPQLWSPFLLDLLKHSDKLLLDDPQCCSWLSSYQAVWSKELTIMVAQRLAEQLAKESYKFQAQEILQRIGEYGSLVALNEVETAFAGLAENKIANYTVNWIADCLAALRLRREMHHAFGVPLPTY